MAHQIKKIIEPWDPLVQIQDLETIDAYFDQLKMILLHCPSQDPATQSSYLNHSSKKCLPLVSQAANKL